jgi:hypothetical protein
MKIKQEFIYKANSLVPQIVGTTTTECAIGIRSSEVNNIVEALQEVHDDQQKRIDRAVEVLKPYYYVKHCHEAIKILTE